MSRNKNQGGGGSRSHTDKTSNAGSRSTVTACPSCKAVTPPGAGFCPACGKPLRDQPARQQRDPLVVALYSIIGIAIVGTLAGLLYVASGNNVAPPPATSVASSPPRSAPAVDLSSISPREAADRLFNRVMMAEEQGNKQEVMQFLPMALQAYDRVEILDADAHYHIGLIHAAAGDLDQVRKQVEILKQFSPAHLLGLLLEYDIAEQSGDRAAATKASTAFASAYALEISSGKPEYEAHRNSIDKFFADKAGG